MSKNIKKIATTLFFIFFAVTTHAKECEKLGFWTKCQDVFENNKGDLYQGSFENNHPNGYGTITFGKMSEKKGDTFTGFFVDGMMHGTGTYQYSNGDKFVGTWAANTKNGVGKLYSNNKVFVQRYDFGILTSNRQMQNIVTKRETSPLLPTPQNKEKSKNILLTFFDDLSPTLLLSVSILIGLFALLIIQSLFHRKKINDLESDKSKAATFNTVEPTINKTEVEEEEEEEEEELEEELEEEELEEEELEEEELEEEELEEEELEEEELEEEAVVTIRGTPHSTTFETDKIYQISFSAKARMSDCGSPDIGDHFNHLQDQASVRGDIILSYVFEGSDLVSEMIWLLFKEANDDELENPIEFIQIVKSQLPSLINMDNDETLKFTRKIIDEKRDKVRRVKFSFTSLEHEHFIRDHYKEIKAIFPEEYFKPINKIKSPSRNEVIIWHLSNQFMQFAGMGNQDGCARIHELQRDFVIYALITTLDHLSSQNFDKFQDSLLIYLEYLRTFNQVVLGYYFENKNISDVEADLLNVHAWMYILSVDLNELAYTLINDDIEKIEQIPDTAFIPFSTFEGTRRILVDNLTEFYNRHKINELAKGKYVEFLNKSFEMIHNVKMDEGNQANHNWEKHFKDYKLSDFLPF